MKNEKQNGRVYHFREEYKKNNTRAEHELQDAGLIHEVAHAEPYGIGLHKKPIKVFELTQNGREAVE